MPGADAARRVGGLIGRACRVVRLRHRPSAHPRRERPMGMGSPPDSHSHPVSFFHLTRHDHGQGTLHRRRQQVFTFLQGVGRGRGDRQAQGPQGGGERGPRRRTCGTGTIPEARAGPLHGKSDRPSGHAGPERAPRGGETGAQDGRGAAARAGAAAVGRAAAGASAGRRGRRGSSGLPRQPSGPERRPAGASGLP